MADLERAGVDVVGHRGPGHGGHQPRASPSAHRRHRAAGPPRAGRSTRRTLRWCSSPYDVQDPGNVGAIVRVAEAGGATGVVAAGACADPFGWKALRGSMGSALRLPIGAAATAAAAVAEARRHGCRVVATVPRGGRSLFDVDLRGGRGVLIGGEGAGLAAATLDAGR